MIKYPSEKKQLNSWKLMWHKLNSLKRGSYYITFYLELLIMLLKLPCWTFSMILSSIVATREINVFDYGERWGVLKKTVLKFYIFF